MNLKRGLLLLFLSPERFATLADADAKHLTKPPPGFAQAARDIRRAVTRSFALVIAAILVGWLYGVLLTISFGPAPRLASRIFQFAGAGILLWATLAKQGWNIQTFNGNTLPERLDRHVYRTLYVIGTCLLVLSVAWTPGP